MAGIFCFVQKRSIPNIMKITFDTDMFTENQKLWFEKLLSEEIDDAIGTADNEQLFMLGAPNEEAAELHHQNCIENTDYALTLKYILDQIKGGAK